MSGRWGRAARVGLAGQRLPAARRASFLTSRPRPGINPVPGAGRPRTALSSPGPCCRPCADSGRRARQGLRLRFRLRPVSGPRAPSKAVDTWPPPPRHRERSGGSASALLWAFDGVRLRGPRKRDCGEEKRGDDPPAVARRQTGRSDHRADTAPGEGVGVRSPPGNACADTPRGHRRGDAEG